MTERTAGGEKLQPTHTLVLTCIDFRTISGNRAWLAKKGLTDGSYHLYASAGASGNPTGFLAALESHSPDLVKVLDHEDCGFYKAANFYSLFESNGHAPYEAHHHNLEILGTQLRQMIPSTDYRYRLLPLNKTERTMHECSAVAIMLGKPQIVKAAREYLALVGLERIYDEIARPYQLTDDPTVLDDLQISLRLHHPSTIIIFESDPTNLEKIAQTVRTEAPDVTLESVLVPQSSPLNQYATLTT